MASFSSVKRNLAYRTIQTICRGYCGRGPAFRDPRFTRLDRADDALDEDDESVMAGRYVVGWSMQSTDDSRRVRAVPYLKHQSSTLTDQSWDQFE